MESEVVQIPIRKILKKRLFFSNQIIPKCDVRLFFSPITNLLIGIVLLFIISAIVHLILYYLWKKEMLKFEVTTFCTKYVAEFTDDMYVFNGVPYGVSPTLMKWNVKDILGRKLFQNSLRWFSTVKLDSVETCFASHSDLCLFNNSVWRCLNSKVRKRCINFQDDESDNNQNNRSEKSDHFAEDCLYLNIKVPKRKPIKSAVIVFVHGTNFATDISNKIGKNYPFDPTGSFVNDIDSIFVSINYRMGPLGSFFDQSLQLDNFAITDLLVAFEWIKVNIEKFGGDPKKITLLAHGTGATLGLSTLLSSSNYFRAAWLASGSVYIPKPSTFFSVLLRDLFVMFDSRCISDSYYDRFCEKRFFELLLISVEKVTRRLRNYYLSENSLSSLLNIDFMLNKTRPQPPFISVDGKRIIDSPHHLIYRNTLPSIPIVFTSMLSELDGFPGERDWNLKTTENLEKEIKTLFQFLFKLSNVAKFLELSHEIWAKIKTKAKKDKKTLNQIVLELFSLLRITCPYYFIGKEMRKLRKKDVFNILHTEQPSHPIRGMLFSSVVKRYQFYGFDILLLFRKEKIFVKSLSSTNQNYQSKLFEIFKYFVQYGVIRETQSAALTGKNLLSLDSYGLREMDNKEYVELCDKLDYNILMEFLNKIN